MIPRDQPIAVRIDVREMIHHGSSLCYAPACDGRRFVQRAFALWIAAGIVISALMTCIAGHRLRDWSAAARQRTAKFRVCDDKEEPRGRRRMPCAARAANSGFVICASSKVRYRRPLNVALVGSRITG